MRTHSTKRAQQSGDKTDLNILHGPVFLRSSLLFAKCVCVCTYKHTHAHINSISYLHLFNIIIENSSATIL